MTTVKFRDEEFQMNFEEQLEYLEENYDGIASLVLQRVTGGVQCKTMSYENCYLKCIDELIFILNKRPELIKQLRTTVIKRKEAKNETKK